MAARLFFSYSHADQAMRDELEKHLVMLRREGRIETFHDALIPPGGDLDPAIKRELEAADVVLLLISADFLASEYCYSIEMERAMARHEGGEACVIPVILRDCDWKRAPFGRLKGLPRDGKPVAKWPDRDEAFTNVTAGIRQALDALPGGADAADGVQTPQPVRAGVVTGSPFAASHPRSSNLALAQRHTDRELDDFHADALSFIRRYFEASADALKERNAGVDYRIVDDGRRFETTIYRDGAAVTSCAIFPGGTMGGRSIAYGPTGGMNRGGVNEWLSVEADDRGVFLSAGGMSRMMGNRQQGARLTLEGGAELFWGMLIKPLQPRGY